MSVSLREVLEAAAREVAIDGAVSADGRVTWMHGDQAFARLDADGRVASFRLDPTLAAAARRTPDTAASDLGPAWVAFAPPVPLDGHAADRAAAWFAAAARRAGS